MNMPGSPGKRPSLFERRRGSIFDQINILTKMQQQKRKSSGNDSPMKRRGSLTKINRMQISKLGSFSTSIPGNL